MHTQTQPNVIPIMFSREDMVNFLKQKQCLYRCAGLTPNVVVNNVQTGKHV